MAFPKNPATRYLVLAVVGLALVGGASVSSASKNVYNDIKTFNRILANVYDKYVDEVDSQELIHASIRGMMDSLDPHSDFLEKKQYDDLMFDTQGKYGGVGISIDIRDEWLTVVSPIEGTPAFKLGIRAGDKVVAIEGESTKGITTSEAAAKLRGRKGTPVTITIVRQGEPQPFDVEIVRDVIEIKSVQYGGIVRDGIGFVRLARFSEESGVEVENALRDVIAQGAKGIVFDLRWNSGGLLTQAVSVSDKFLERGKLISYTQGRRASDRSEYRATENPVVPRDIPVVVLVNGSTASASEIVSGALQDDGRGVVLGELTYGKGLVQTLIPLDADANLKLTTARWYTPSGRCIQKDFDEERAHADAGVAALDSLEVEGAEEVEKKRETGGIQPDIVVEGDHRTWYAFELERGNHFFRFAVDWTTKHPEVPRDWRADDRVIEAFRTYLAGENFDYETMAERELDRLRELATEEEYGKPTIAALDALGTSLHAEKTHDFEKNLDYIRMALEREVMSKEYGEVGMWEAILRYDTQAQAAMDLLLDPEAYGEALHDKAAIAAVGGNDG